MRRLAFCLADDSIMMILTCAKTLTSHQIWKKADRRAISST